jgi:nucleoside-diphosphate-sugar epimerase
MKLLVTGAAGFTGRALIGAVLRAEPAALVVGLGPRRPSEALPSGVIWETGSAAEPSKVAALIRAHRLDHVAHLARTTREGDPATLMRSQAGGALGLLHGVREAGGVERVLLLGSAAEYGLWEERDLPIPETREPHPVSAYGYSKLAETTVGLLAHRQLGVPALVARVFNPVGPGQDPSFVCGSLV